MAATAKAGTNNRAGDCSAILPLSALRFPQQREITLKLVIIGDLYVGKTSLVLRYANNVFRRDYKPTLGVDFRQKELQWSDDLKVKLQLWDISGSERFISMTRAYYRNADGCLVMFALDDPGSFHRAARWKQDLDDKCRLPDGSPVPSLLVGNKSDVSNRKITRDQMHELSTHCKFIGWREVSVQENLGVDEAMRFLIQEMLEKTDTNEQEKPSADTLGTETSTIFLRFGSRPADRGKRRTCC